MDEKRKLKRIIKEKGSRGNSEYEELLHLDLRDGSELAVEVMIMRLASDIDKGILDSRHRMARLVERLRLAIERCDFRHWKRDLDRLQAERRILKEKFSEWLKENRI